MCRVKVGKLWKRGLGVNVFRAVKKMRERVEPKISQKIHVSVFGDPAILYALDPQFLQEVGVSH